MDYPTLGKLSAGYTVLDTYGDISWITEMSSGPEFDGVRRECEKVMKNPPMCYQYLIRTDDIEYGMAAVTMLFDRVNRMNEYIVADDLLCDKLKTVEPAEAPDEELMKRLYERAAAREIPMVILGRTNIDLDDYNSCGFAAVIELTPPKFDKEGADIYLADEAETNGYTVLDIRKPSYVPLFHSAVRYLYSRNRSSPLSDLYERADSAVNELCGSEKYLNGGFRDMQEAEHDLFDILGERFVCRLRRVYDGNRWSFEPAETVTPSEMDKMWDAAAEADEMDDDDYFDRAIEEYMRDIENDPNVEDEDYYEDDWDDEPGDHYEEYEEEDWYDDEEYPDDESADDEPAPEDDDIFGSGIGDFVYGSDGKLHPAGGSPFDGSPLGGSPFGGSPFGADDFFNTAEQQFAPPVKVQNIDEFIGLDDIKKKFKDIVQSYTFERKISGADGISEGLNILFLGNPGTAKTSVARAFAKYLEEAGITPPNSFVELKKSDIVGKYVGHTEHQIDDIFKRFAGGATILWDEIYALAGEQRTVYDEQAVTSILQNMENYRGRIINIFVGYKEPMMRFLDANQGLRSRITDTVYFEDLDNETLAKIFCSFAEKKGIHIADDCTDILVRYFADDKSIEGDNFGNGRTARNLFNSAFRFLADRMGYKYDEGDTLEMTREDVEKAINDNITEAKRIASDRSAGDTHIGFAV